MLFRLVLVAMSLLPLAGRADISAVERALESGLPDLALSELSRIEASIGDAGRQAKQMSLLRLQAAVLAGRRDEGSGIGIEDLPPGPESGYWLARWMADSGMMEPAESLLSEVEINGADDLRVEARYQRAGLLLRMRETDSAVEALDPEWFPPSSRFDAFRRRQELLLFLGRSDQAAAEISRLEPPENEADRLVLNLLAGRAAFAAGNYAQAVGHFDEARQNSAWRDPADRDAAWLGAIRARIGLARHEEALDLLAAFIDRRAQSPLLEKALRLVEEISGGGDDPRVLGWTGAADPRVACLAAAAMARVLPMDRALELLETVLRDHPESPYSIDLVLTRCVLMLENDQAGAVAEEMDKLTQARLTDAQAARLSYLKARIAHENGDSRDALERLIAGAGRVRGDEASVMWQNIAILSFLTDNADSFEEAITRLAAGSSAQAAMAARLLLERGLYLSSRDPSLARLMVWRYLRAAPDDPEHYRAEIVLAEIALREEPPAPEKARDRLRRIPADAPEAILEQRDYLLVWAADLDGRADATITAADAFLQRWPQSEQADEIRFKAGETEIAQGRFARARRYFELIADNPASSLREQALFQAARASALGLTESGLDHALTLFQRTADLNGPLRHPARQQQAEILMRRGDITGAAAVLEDALRENPGPEPENRRSLTCQLAEILSLDPAEESPRRREALRYFHDLRQEPDAPAYWRNRASWFLGKAADQAGQPEEALGIWYQVMDAQLAAENGPEETEWSFRCGMSAIDLLGREGRWQPAAALAERLGASSFPQAAEARALAERIRLEKFLWREPPRLSDSPVPSGGEAAIPAPSPIPDTP